MKINAWVTMGIRTSCKHKRELYLLHKNSNDPLLKNYDKLYYKMLSNIMREAKQHTIVNRLRTRIIK